MSYNAVKENNEAASNLLFVWVNLDNRSLWYGLLAAASWKSAIATKRSLELFGELASNGMEFACVVGLLRSYFLMEEIKDLTGHLAHLVLHRWILYTRL